MKYEPQIQAANIVVRGTFNPAIFSPAWFALNKVITPQELTAASVEIVHADISRFSINPIKVAVVQDSVTVECLQEPYIRLAEFVLHTFRLLHHTPVSQVGINYQVHFNLSSWEQRVNVGRALAPLDPWGAWGKAIESANTPSTTGGMNSLTMQQNAPDGRSGHRWIRVEPSSQLDPHTGIFMGTNDHYNITTADQLNSVAELIKIIETNFDASINWSKNEVASMMDFMATQR
ncbi:MAG: hypothetical protein KF779_09735 [Hyphomonadaceae bacterium]|nr:hypothetical protein [Hyphomonadaceae bacterium]